jgi:hypothetical protein
MFQYDGSKTTDLINIAAEAWKQGYIVIVSVA